MPPGLATGLAVTLGVLGLFGAVLLITSMYGKSQRARGREEQANKHLTSESENAEEIRRRIQSIEARNMSRDELVISLNRMLDKRRSRDQK